MSLLRKAVVVACCLLPLTGVAACNRGPAQDTAPPSGGAAKKDLTFVIVPKVVHPWFDQVNKGAQKQADALGKQLGVNVKIDYRAPQKADLAEQNTVLEQAAATNPDGVALDPLDYNGNKAVIDEIKGRGIPVILFDAPSPKGSGLTSVGNDFTEQSRIADEALMKLIGGKGKVAVMQGVPTAPNHAERYQAHIDFLKAQPGIEIVDGGKDNDSIEEAKQQASAVLAANPDLVGYLSCDAAGPIGIATAVKESGKVGKVKIVGTDNLIDVLQFIKDGTISSTSSTLPTMQGAQSVNLLWQASQKMELPQKVDTGIAVIDKDNVDEWIQKVK